MENMRAEEKRTVKQVSANANATQPRSMVLIAMLILATFLNLSLKTTDIMNSIKQESWLTAITNSSIHDVMKSEPKQSPNPYTAASLAANPFLGWAPPLVNSNDTNFSWRSCFYNAKEIPHYENPKTAEGLGLPGCYESPSELGNVPTVNSSWIPDVTMLHTMMTYGKDIKGNPFPPILSKELCEEINDEGSGNVTDENKQCFRESMIQSTAPLYSSGENITINPSNHAGVPGDNVTVSVRPPKVLCLIYTMEVRHATRVRAIRETWAGGCDGFLAFSTVSDPRIPAMHVKHSGKEEYKNMWQKVRSIWKFVGQHYLEQFDWFYIGGDDLFVLPQNLKNYLASLLSKDGSDPKQKGLHHKTGKVYFNTGGGGYALSQAALRKLVTKLDDSMCSPSVTSSAEDTLIAKCLSHLGITVTDTRDNKGRERFHFWSPRTQFQLYKLFPKGKKGWFPNMMKDWGVHEGPQCCAPDSISFHYVKQPAMVRHFHAMIYACKD